MTGEQDTDEHVDVLPAAGRRAHPQGLVESADGHHGVPAHGEVRACAEPADLERELRGAEGRAVAVP